MVVIISPAKRQRLANDSATGNYTFPVFSEEAALIAEYMKQLSVDDLVRVLNSSYDLADQAFLNFQAWRLPFLPSDSRQAVLLFDGDVYDGLKANSLSGETLAWSQSHLRILSALYGLLRPLDLIRPYRLEMAHQIRIGNHVSLYSFWKRKITEELSIALKESASNVMINLASAEYSRAIDLNTLGAEVITPEFMDFHNGKFRMISFYAKRARGLMTRFILENRITSPDELKAFDLEGYFYDPRLSKKNTVVFTRGG